MKRFLLISFYSVCCALPVVAQPQSVSSLSLSALRDSALQNNIALRRARLEIESSSHQRKEAFTKYFPTVSAVGMWFNANRGMAKMDIDPSEFVTPEMGAALATSLPASALTALSSPMSMTMMKNGTIAGITAMQPVFAGGQIVLGNKLARVGEEASHLQLQMSENDVESQVEQYYWQLVSMYEKQRTLDVSDSLLAAIYNDVTAAVEVGVTLRNDLLQVKLRQNELKSQRLKLNNGMAIMHLLITQFCGLQGEWELQEPSFDPAPASDTSASQAASFLPALPEYQLLQKNVEAATLQRRMEVGKNLPSLAVGAGYNYHNLMENDRHFGMVFATVSVPISDWWGGSHAIKRRRIAERQAREQLEDNTQQLAIRIQKASNDVVEARSQLSLADEGIQQAEENLRVYRDTYQAGTASMSDLLQAQLLHQQALDRRTDAYISLQSALLDYRHSTGQ